MFCSEMGAQKLGQPFPDSYFVSEHIMAGLISNKSLRDTFPNPRHFKEIVREGFPASLNLITVGVVIFVITYFISRFGKELD